MDQIEDYWERGPGARPPAVGGINHALAVYGWDLRDALERDAESSERAIADAERRRVRPDRREQPRRARRCACYPRYDDAAKRMTLLDAARALGDDGGIETLIVFLGANNALGAVTDLKVAWSGDDFRELPRRSARTPSGGRRTSPPSSPSSRPRSRRIDARHVIWATVPHVTIAPIARGVGRKVGGRLALLPVLHAAVDRRRAASIRARTRTSPARRRAPSTTRSTPTTTRSRRPSSAPATAGRDWYLFDVARRCSTGSRTAASSRTRTRARRGGRRTRCRPSSLALDPVPDSRFLTGDGNGGRASGGLFSLDGVHPTTVAYGLIAQEIIDIMRRAGVEFRTRRAARPVTVDFDRLIARDTLIEHPPQNLRPGLKTLAWADQTLDWLTRIFRTAG